MKPATSRRSIRLADLIMQEIASMLAFDVADPRLSLVTVSGVRLNKDLSIAEVLYTVRGGTEHKDEVQAALDKAKGFLRSSLGKRLKLKFLPDLRFTFDAFLEDIVYARKGPGDIPDNQG